MPNVSKQDYARAIDNLAGFLARAGVKPQEIDKKRQELKGKPDDEIVKELAKFLSATHKRIATDKLVEFLKRNGAKQDEIDKKRKALEPMSQNQIVKELAALVASARKRDGLEVANAPLFDVPPPTYACHFGRSSCSDLLQDECTGLPQPLWHGPGVLSPDDPGHTCPT
jgi:hypothetical protein